jgi:hypothetical protein
MTPVMEERGMTGVDDQPPAGLPAAMVYPRLSLRSTFS